MKSVAAFLSGALFATGLYISGMTRPENIIGFLDFFGAWKPALAFVMIGAVGVYAVLYPLVLKRHRPLYAPAFDIPSTHKIDARLIAGAIAFGIGWGLGGLCPGPALVAFGSGARMAFVWMAALLTGIALHHFATNQGTSGDQDTCG